MEKSGISIKVIDKKRERCEELASNWNDVTVINANTADHAMLKEQGIENVDAFVALAGLDEENILLSLFAKEWGVKKMITKINRIDYDNVMAKLDLDTVVCPKNLTADMILRFVRSAKKSRSSNMQNLYNIVEGKIEAAEFLVKEGAKIIGKPLRELRLKKDTLVTSIVRGGKVILPRGSDCIAAGDIVIVVTKDTSLFVLEDILD